MGHMKLQPALEESQVSSSTSQEMDHATAANYHIKGNQSFTFGMFTRVIIVACYMKYNGAWIT